MSNIKNNQRHLLCLGSKENLKYNRAELADIDPESVPTLIPADILKKWQIGDENPKYKIQAIEYPIKANGYIYDESFFESFVNALKDRPMPGARSGHEMGYGKKGNTDLLLIGGKLDKKENGAGIVYFKNYIPPIGESGDNSIFIKELDSDMIHFSLVAYTQDMVKDTPDGGREWHVVEYKYGGRNDAVEYGTGAMKQKTNKKIDKDKSGVAGEDITQGREIMKEDELLTALKENKDNALILPKILAALGIETVTEKHKNALQIVSDFTALGVNDPVNSYKTLKDKVEADKLAVFNARLDKEFGINDKENPNLIREQAGESIKMCSDEKELLAQIAAFKEKPLIKMLSAEQANVFSRYNQIGISDKQGNKEMSVNSSNNVIGI